MPEGKENAHSGLAVESSNAQPLGEHESNKMISGASFHRKEQTGANSIDVAANMPVIEHRTLIRELEIVTKTLQRKNADWKDRADALERLRNCAGKGGPAHKEFIATLLQLKDTLIVQIKDLRSSIVKEACAAVSSIAQSFQRHASGGRLQAGWAGLALGCVEACLKQVPVTIKIISESADNCIREILHALAPCGYSKLLSKLCIFARDKNAIIRRHSTEYIGVALDRWSAFWRTGSSGKHLAEVRDSLRVAMHDSDNGTRSAARNCFWLFQKCSPESASKLLDRFDDATRRRINDACPLEKMEPSAAPKAVASTTVAPKINVPEPRPSAAPVTISPTGSASVASSFSASPMEKPDAGAVEPENKPRPERVESAAGNGVKNEYVASDYASAGGIAKRVGGAQRVVSRQAARAKNNSSTSGTANGPGRQLGGGAMRVQPVAAATASSDNVSKSNSPLGSASGSVPGTASSTGAPQTSNEIHSVAVSSFAQDKGVNTNLEILIGELEASHHWSTRQEAMRGIMRRHQAGGVVNVPGSTITKLVKVMCERASDQHFKVAHEVLNGITVLLPLLIKEFGEHLRELLIALLLGAGNTRSGLRQPCEEGLHLCIEHYSKDQLCAVLASVCSKKGDSLRLSCLVYLAKIVPLSSTYFSSQAHIMTLISRLEPCLFSRKPDLRNAASKLLKEVQRSHPKAYAEVITGGEIEANLLAKVTKAVPLKNSTTAPKLTKTKERSPTKPIVAPANDAPESFSTAQSKLPKSEPVLAPVSAQVDSKLASPLGACERHGTGSQDVSLAAEVPGISPELVVDESTTSTSATTCLATPEKADVEPPAQASRSLFEKIPEGTPTILSTEQQLEQFVNVLTSATSKKQQVLTALKQLKEIVYAPSGSINWESWTVQLAMVCLDNLNSATGVVQNDSIDALGALAKQHSDYFCGNEIAFGILCRKLFALYNVRSFKAAPAVDAALETIFNSCDEQRCLQVLFEPLLGVEGDEILKVALWMLVPVVGRLPSGDLVKVLPTLVPPVAQAFSHPWSSIRQRACRCFVEFNMLLGDLFIPYMACLSKNNNKLVHMYMKKAQQSSA